ncbi:MAG: hypothetical protein PHY54_04830 [Methylococcales bacterium]|nr:hypothetical protein [Methylococcales bacterium]
MNSKIVSVLISVCIACVFIIAGEWYYSVQEEKHALASAISAGKKISTDEMPAIELIRQPEESYADFVSRPLFINGRRPVEELSPEEAQNAAEANIFDWELNGVYTTKKGLSALFSRSKSKAAKDNYRRISVGADLSGWKLTEIRTDRAMLKQGAQQKELLLRKPKLKDLSKQPNRPNVPNSPPPAEGNLENTNE